MYFDRILFSAVFATLFGTAALALAPAVTSGDSAAAPLAAAVEQPALPSLERVVVTAKKEASSI